MALRKEAQRRYSSVEQFSEDLHRHMTGVPVSARKDTLLYRTDKFVRRHRALAAASALVLLMMITATVVTSWQAQVARQERAHAELLRIEADMQRQRAERETEFAKQQLTIAQQRTREAELERAKAQRNAREAHAISTEMLALNADLPQDLTGLEAGKRVASSVTKVLSGLGLEGYNNPSLRKDLEKADIIGRKYEELVGRMTSSPPDGWQLEGSPENEFQSGTDKIDPAAGSTAYIRSRHSNTRGYATLCQLLSIEPYAGKRVRLSALLRSRSIETRGELHLGFESKEGTVHFYSKSPLRGTNAWSRHHIVADISPEATSLHIGFELRDAGAIWADDFILEVVDASVPLTNTDQEAPLDLDFEGRK